LAADHGRERGRVAPEKATTIIHDGPARNWGRIAFPWPMALGAWLVGAMPNAPADRLTRTLPQKG